MQRVMHMFPKQGDREPWINPQDYRRDKKMFRKSPVADGVMRFARLKANAPPNRRTATRPASSSADRWRRHAPASESARFAASSASCCFCLANHVVAATRPFS